MLAQLHQDLLAWSEWLDRTLTRSCLGYPGRSTIAAARDGMGRSSVYGCRVALFGRPNYYHAISRTVGRLPDDQRELLAKIYLCGELRPGSDGKSPRTFYRHLHKLHASIADLLRET
jgi:hypothetical protein